MLVHRPIFSNWVFMLSEWVFLSFSGWNWRFLNQDLLFLKFSDGSEIYQCNSDKACMQIKKIKFRSKLLMVWQIFWQIFGGNWSCCCFSGRTEVGFMSKCPNQNPGDKSVPVKKPTNVTRPHLGQNNFPSLNYMYMDIKSQIPPQDTRAFK